MPGPSNYVLPFALFPSIERTDDILHDAIAILWPLMLLFTVVVGVPVMVLMGIERYKVSQKPVPSKEEVRQELKRRSRLIGYEHYRPIYYQVIDENTWIRGNIYRAILELASLWNKRRKREGRYEYRGVDFLDYHIGNTAYEWNPNKEAFIDLLVKHIMKDEIVGLREIKIH
jgi:hypothetical protein